MKPLPFQPGDRIELIEMLNDPCPIPSGATGTVQRCQEVLGHIHVDVKWDIERSHSLCMPPDIAWKVGELHDDRCAKRRGFPCNCPSAAFRGA